MPGLQRFQEIEPEGSGREGGGREIRMGNTCKSMADSCQCMAKTSLQLIKINEKKKKNLLGQDHGQWWFGKDLLKFGLRLFLQCNTSPILLFLKPKHNGSTAWRHRKGRG